jgi:chaperonin GroES
MKKSQIKPLHDRVIVLPDESMEITSGGIIIPDTAQEKPQSGIVIEVGTGSAYDTLLLKRLNLILKLLLWICKGIAKLTGHKLEKEHVDDASSTIVKKGDHVLYGKHAGSEIEIDNKKHLIMRESEIIAIV